MNWKILVRRAKAKQAIKKLDKKIEERLEEIYPSFDDAFNALLNDCIREGKITLTKTGDFRDSTFLDTYMRRNR